MTAVTAAERFPVGQPQAALAVESEARISVARRLLEALRVFRIAGDGGDHVRGRQLRDRLHPFAVFEANDADGSAAVERLAALGEGAVVVAPLLRPFLVGDPQPAPGVVADGGTRL